ncbi:DUF4383 domain-containing protein [Candidatus Pacearchaeota archaeon]|nr:DUF4383 domain-containing protein [Candidatus Pacearchaeota archaeon]
MVVGIVLVILGLWGFFQNPILNWFGVNTAQNIVHIIAGALGIWLGTKDAGKSFNLWLGWVALVVGVLGLIPGVRDLLAQLLGINAGISWLHIILGIVALIVAYAVKE